MTLHINFKLSQSDLDQFCQDLKQARESSPDVGPHQIIERTKQRLGQVIQSDARDFILTHILQLKILIAMLEDNDWHLEADDRERVLTALSYFVESADLIPDDIPGLGFIDDAIMIEIVCQQLQHEIQAYRDFVKDCDERRAQVAREKPSGEDAKWLEERRAQLHARMRRRRNNRPASNKSKSPFSLF